MMQKPKARVAGRVVKGRRSWTIAKPRLSSEAWHELKRLVLASELRELGGRSLQAHEIAQWVEHRYQDLLAALSPIPKRRRSRS